jgi:hypothetical protein
MRGLQSIAIAIAYSGEPAARRCGALGRSSPSAWCGLVAVSEAAKQRRRVVWQQLVNVRGGLDEPLLELTGHAVP